MDTHLKNNDNKMPKNDYLCSIKIQINSDTQQQYYNAGTVTIWISRKWEIAIWILILRFIFERLIRFLFMKHNLQNIRLQYALFQLANIHSHK